MTKRRNRRFWAATAVCALAFEAASGKTKIVETTRHEGAAAGPARKVLVVAVTTDARTRNAFEDVIAGELSLRGVKAVPSYTDYPELPKDRAALEAKLAEGGFDSVLVSRLVDKTDKVEWKEGGTSFDAQYIGMDFWGGYMFAMQQISVPGYLEKETRVRVRSDLWRTSDKGGWLQWSGSSESIDPLTAPRAARQIGVAVAKSLAKAKLI